MLYDKFELDTLPGRITLGVLVVQDLMAILFLAIQPSLNDLQIDVALLSVVRVGALLAATLLISRYTLPHLFQLIAHLPELVLVGALAWCFAVSEFAEFLGLSRVMGALIAGVSLSTFPYAIDVTAKITSLRDFFITLFFVALGMTIPLPTPSVLGLALVLVAFTWISRFVTVFPALYAMRQGLRASLLPAINLAQISEFSLVLVQIGVQSGHTTPGIAGAASTAFVVLAVLNTFLMMRSDAATRRIIPILKRLGLSDLDHEPRRGRSESQTELKRRILILGFYRIASSFLAELERRKSALLEQVFVVDFNPNVYHALQERGIKVYYNDISNADSLIHAGLADAEIVISSVPDSLLEGHHQREARSPCAHGQSDREDHRDRGGAGGDANPLCRRRRLRDPGAARSGQRTDRRGHRRRGRPARRPQGQARRATARPAGDIAVALEQRSTTAPFPDRPIRFGRSR